MSDCSICCEPFNKSNRSKINCKSCETQDIIACQSCAKRYILDQPTDASCMICKMEWDTEFLMENFTKKFVSTELKSHRENYLLDKQIALLPETQEFAEQLKLIDGLEKQKSILNIEKRKLEKKIRELNSNISQIDHTISDIRYGTPHSSSKSEFVFKCPVDGCNGFLNNKYECGICDNKICRHCMEIKGEDHECDEEKKQTVELLRKDTKPCPKCGQLINKINGCDQMYCIKCHTGFSWRTGQVERGNIHNPEYYRWMRENGRDIPRNPGDVPFDPCGNDIIDYSALLRLVRIYFPPEYPRNAPQQPANGRRLLHTPYQTITDHPQTIKIINMHRMVHHINHLNRGFTAEEQSTETTLRNMRAQYILNKLTRDEFKKRLQQIEKKNNKSKKLNDIWNVLRLVLIEYIGKIAERRYRDDRGVQVIEEIIKESEKIRKYCNKSFGKVGSIFNMTYPGINPEWIQINNWDAHMKELERRKVNQSKLRNTGS